MTVVGAEIMVRAESRLQCVDITDEVAGVVLGSGVGEGCCVVYCTHTTCAVLVNEWEDGALEDLARQLDLLFPPGAYYAHDDMTLRTQNVQPGERANGHSHLAQMVMGSTSQTVPVTRRELWLGRWQRIFLIELDEPKDRSLYVQVMGV
jgi:secondary thiamine-phosphate synthase enzyme